MAETAAGVKWEAIQEGNIIYEGDEFRVGVFGTNWRAYVDAKLVTDNYATDHATAKQQAERWILEREGRLPAPDPATDGGWIACSERMPEVGVEVEVRCFAIRNSKGWHSGKIGPPNPTHWRPIPADPHKDAACLFGDDRPTAEEARAAARHVVECEVCRAKLEAKGGA